MPREDFHKHLRQCENHSLLTLTKLSSNISAMVSYVRAIGLAIEQKKTSSLAAIIFLKLIDITFSHVISALLLTNLEIATSIVICSSSSMLLSTMAQPWISSLNAPARKTLSLSLFILTLNLRNSKMAKWALLLYCISQDTAACKRGFSTMNFVVVWRLNVIVCLALPQDCHSVESFPYH